MGRTVYRYDIPLKTIAFYIEDFKKYFGLSHPSLEREIELLRVDPDRTFRMPDLVPLNELESLLRNYFPRLDENQNAYFKNLLWLVCNLYYGNSNANYQLTQLEEINQDFYDWESIREEIVSLYIFMQDHMDAQAMSISFGKGKKHKLPLNNYTKWVQGILNSQVFPNCIPEITSKEIAQNLLTKKKGRPVERVEANAIVHGVASLFYDEGVVVEKAPKELLGFIRDILVMMALIEPNDETVNTDWIRSQISNLSAPGKDARLPNAGSGSYIYEELKEEHVERKRLDWIFHGRKTE